MLDVARVLEEVRAKSSELANKELVPVVIIYRKKPEAQKPWYAAIAVWHDEMTAAPRPRRK